MGSTHTASEHTTQLYRRLDRCLDGLVRDHGEQHVANTLAGLSNGAHANNDPASEHRARHRLRAIRTREKSISSLDLAKLATVYKFDIDCVLTGRPEPVIYVCGRGATPVSQM